MKNMFRNSLISIKIFFYHHLALMPQYFLHLFMYTYSFFTNGLIFAIVGPLIPFLAAQDHRIETDYSFFFICVSLGAFLASLTYKFLHHNQLLPDHHLLVGIVSIVYCIDLFLFPFCRNIYLRGLLISIHSACNSVQCQALNSSMVLVASRQSLLRWLSICHVGFGVGALVIPLLVSVLQKNTYLILAVMILVTAPIYLVFLPAHDLELKEQKEELQIGEQRKITVNEGVDEVNPREVSSLLLVLFGLNYMLFMGLENLNAGWISSYATMTRIASKKEATIFSTVFWLSDTLVLFLLGFIRLKVGTKIKRVTELGALSAVICLILSAENLKMLATWLCAIVQGIGIAGIYPLMLALPSEFNLCISEGHFSTMMLLISLSQGLIVYPTGLLMKNISVQFFFIILVVTNTIRFFNTHWIVWNLEKERLRSEEADDDF